MLQGKYQCLLNYNISLQRRDQIHMLFHTVVCSLSLNSSYTEVDFELWILEIFRKIYLWQTVGILKNIWNWNGEIVLYAQLWTT